MINNFFTIIPNILYRGSAPSNIDVFFLKYKFGINKIISLDKESSDHINKICKILDIEHITIDLNEHIKSLIHLFSFDLDSLFFNNAPIFIHCKYGRDRTGFVSALIKIRYLNWTPTQALNEAKLLGFGKFANPKMINLYEKIIKALKPIKQDNNSSDDIVEHTREHNDFAGSVIDNATMQSFAPYLDTSKQYPYSPTYNYRYDQWPTRNNFDFELINNDPPVNNAIPEVGVYEANEGIKGVGPVENPYFGST